MNIFLKPFRVSSQESKALHVATIASFLLILPAVIGLAIDDRMLMGVNVWLKPLKFAISQGIYTLSIAVLFSLYPYSRRKKAILGHTIAWTMMIELLIIFYQASRGVQSHYNMNSPLDGMLYGVMGIFISVNVILMLLFLFDTIRLKMNTSKSIQWSIFLAWLIVIIGCAVGGQMIGQLGHNVGVADGGPGLPVTNWSTIAGDLRIAHFFGLHGLQIIPLFAFFLGKKTKQSTLVKVMIVTLFASIYAAWIGFTYYQASLGLPLIETTSIHAI